MRLPARRFTAAIVVVVAALGVLVSQSPEPVIATGSDDLGPAGVPLSEAPFDQQYIDVLALHHRTAISMSEMAVRTADRPRLKALAREIIMAQREELRTLHDWRARWYGDPSFESYELSEHDLRMLGITPGAKRELKQAENFDHAYVDRIIPHHAGALTLSRWAVDQASHERLRGLASAVIDMQGEEIWVFTKLHRRWFGRD